MLSPRPDSTLEQLQDRVSRRRATRRRYRFFGSPLADAGVLSSEHSARLRRLPGRLWLHLLIVLMVPAAALLSNMALALPPLPAPPESTANLLADEAIVPVSPLNLDAAAPRTGEAIMPDSAFDEIIALAEVQRILSEQDFAAPPTVAATTVGDQVNVRNGPGLEYDRIGKLTAGSNLILDAYVGDWFVARTANGEKVWVAAELVSEAAVARSILPLATDIPPPPPPKVALVREEGLSLRDGPGTNYIKMQSLKDGLQIDLLSRYADWFEARLPDGKIGWVSGEYLNIGPNVVERIEVLTQAPDPNPALVAWADGKINLRNGPSTDYPRVGATANGTKLDLVGRYKDWLKVRTPEGKVAWVSGEVLPVSAYITRRVPVTQNFPPLPRPPVRAPRPGVPGNAAAAARPAPVPAANAGGLVAFALQFRGTPYRWGGSSPGGFDCSGFVRYVYGQYGLHLPHSAAGQYNSAYGAFVDKGSLAPGDIVFFANTYRRGISHVGIYIGNGLVLQALAPGTPLSAVSMYGGYWQSKYYGALRPRI